MPAVDEDLITRFKAMLDAPAPQGRQKEQVVQDFLEANTVLVPMTNLDHHGLHMRSIVSKFPLGTALTTDYAYLTKNSGRYLVTFVELEKPEKAIFTSDLDRPTFTAEFNGALAQIKQWQHYVDEHRAAVRESLAKLMRPMSGNKLMFAYQLIIGRSPTKNRSDAHKAMFVMEAERAGIEILTYDQLIDRYRTGPRCEKSIMVASRERFAFKHLAADVGDLLSYHGPDALKFSKEQRAELVSRGHEMDAWDNGETLSIEGKRVLRVDEEVAFFRDRVMDQIRGNEGAGAPE
ncbi:DUF4263 domain-containing protein [Sphingopyxis indica]|uniref:Shedu immune nuclease family protein n=1 Tax=Sphingopyxis indica TaxID=436663 RepID=UPI00293902DB|nr:Shedu immune nuclease family protein [Sphingopyxis indica]WOF43274.1 DUF4263 domain-containing protein [Sphingopyxis indica]